MIEYMPDINVFSKIFTGDLVVTKFVEHLEAVIDATIYIESLQGSKSHLEKRVIKKVIDNFPLLPLTPKISQRAIELIDKYSNSHGSLLPDALVAATALENDLAVVTFNIGDFKFINGLKYLKSAV